MAKPIFIMRIPIETVKAFSWEQFETVSRKLQRKLKDYHVLTMVDNAVTEAQFECFNADNVTEKDIKDIKEMVFNSIKEIQ
jgi:hypothetical protein